MARRILAEDRCPRCYMRLEMCLCPLIPELSLSTKLVIVMHLRESKATTNTGRLAAMAIKGSEIRIRGEKDRPMSGVGIVEPGRQALLLYPADDAVTVTKDWLAQFTEPFTLIVPDGTWRQAFKIAKRIPELAGVPRIKLPVGKASTYRLRRAPQSHCLSTMEAIARVLGMIEGKEIQESLEGLFHTMVTRTLMTRTPDSLASRLGHPSEPGVPVAWPLLQDLQNCPAPEFRGNAGEDGSERTGVVSLAPDNLSQVFLRHS